MLNRTFVMFIKKINLSYLGSKIFFTGGNSLEAILNASV